MAIAVVALKITASTQGTRSDRSQELRPQCSRYECIRSRFSIEPLRNVGTRLVNHHHNIVSLRDQLLVAALYKLAVVFFRLDHKQKLVHESSHPPRGTRLAQRRHVKNDVVEVARF